MKPWACVIVLGGCLSASGMPAAQSQATPTWRRAERAVSEGWWAEAASVDHRRSRKDFTVARLLGETMHRTEVALAAGEVTHAQAGVIVDAVRALPASVGPEDREKAEQHLLEQAAEFNPKQLRVLGRRLIDVIDPDAADERLAAQLKAEERTTVLLVEQNVAMASALGDHVAVMDGGRIVHAGPMAALAADEALQQRLLGLSLEAG